MCAGEGGGGGVKIENNGITHSVSTIVAHTHGHPHMVFVRVRTVRPGHSFIVHIDLYILLFCVLTASNIVMIKHTLSKYMYIYIYIGRDCGVAWGITPRQPTTTTGNHRCVVRRALTRLQHATNLYLSMAGFFFDERTQPPTLPSPLRLSHIHKIVADSFCVVTI